MSHKEVVRLEMIQLTNKRHLTQQQTALRLGLSGRQIKRPVKRYREQDPAGMVSGRRGKTPNNAISPAVKNKALALMCSTYPDLSPAFAHEKLTEQHGLWFSVEILRQWMIKADIWIPKSRKKARIHQSSDP